MIKSVDKEALVAVGGLGWPSYLDAICRYTDEPFEGKEDPAKYPFKGGAYFDCMSFHAYPHLDNSLKIWDEETGEFQYTRHSDAAVNGVWQLKNKFGAVLHKYGYDNEIYPEKYWICTEFNIPRRSFEGQIGSESAQVNFLIKTLITAQLNDMRQMHVYSIADENHENKPDNPFAYMGLFQNLENVALDDARPNAIAWALKTTENLLQNTTYNTAQSKRLNLPTNVRGAAFRNALGQFTYVLWAVTNQDQDESVEVNYAFPPEFTLKYVDAKPWHYSQSGTHYLMNAKQLRLTGSPLFLTETLVKNDYSKAPKIIPNPIVADRAVFEFWMLEEARATVEIFDSAGHLVTKVMEDERLIIGPQALTLDLSALPSGTYFIRLITPDGNLTEGFVKD